MKFPVLIGLVALAITWCSDYSAYNTAARNTEKVLATCKMKAVAIYRVEEWDTGSGDAAGYMRICMQAEGYLVDWACTDGVWDTTSCYQPDTPEGRKVIESERKH